jgi:hypothetical protein
MWENDRRGKAAGSQDVVGRIAEALQLSPDERKAMVGMWLAAASIDAIPADEQWFHNFPEPSGPVWVWLRGAPGRARQQHVTLEIGPFDRQFGLPELPGGLIVHALASVPTGTIPPAVAQTLGIQVVDAREIIGAHAPARNPWTGKAPNACSHP